MSLSIAFLLAMTFLISVGGLALLVWALANDQFGMGQQAAETIFAPGEVGEGPVDEEALAEEALAEDGEPAAEEPVADADEGEGEEENGEESSSARRYRTQRRGGKGLRDIKAGERNGKVVSIVRVNEDDELLMMTARGKIQRIKVSDLSVIGRNTQGVRIMSLDEADSLAAVVRVPQEEGGADDTSDEPAAEA